MQGLDTFEMTNTCKEESSDESTIISSQTSTLTRNQGKAIHDMKIDSQIIYNTNSISYIGPDGIQSTLAEELEDKLNCYDDDQSNNDASGENDDNESSTTEDRGLYSIQNVGYGIISHHFIETSFCRVHRANVGSIHK